MSGLRGTRRSRGLFVLCVLGSATALFGFGSRAEAGGKHHRPQQVVVPSVCVVPTARVLPAQLGSGFTSTPYIIVRGSAPTGGGLTPLDGYGDSTLSLYGPLSALRSTSAPIYTYTRGYDGRTVVTPATSFSTPNLPALSPVIYPTQATNFWGSRRLSVPPWQPNALNWIDQN